jgi:hypothetical protein
MTKIYKLYSITKPDLIYIGSTGLDLQVRLAQHVICWDSFKRGLNMKRISSYEIIETGEYSIEELQVCSAEERFKIEQKWIDTIKCVNKNSAYTGIIGNQKTKESWRIYQRMHYAKNKEAHLARKLRYYNNIKQELKNRRRIARYFRELPLV